MELSLFQAVGIGLSCQSQTSRQKWQGFARKESSLGAMILFPGLAVHRHGWRTPLATLWNCSRPRNDPLAGFGRQRIRVRPGSTLSRGVGRDGLKEVGKRG